MEKIIKKSQPFVWLAAIMFSVFFAVGCTDTSDKTEEVKTDTMVTPAVVEPATVMPADTLPPIDTSATPRPVPIKTNH